MAITGIKDTDQPSIHHAAHIRKSLIATSAGIRADKDMLVRGSWKSWRSRRGQSRDNNIPDTCKSLVSIKANAPSIKNIVCGYNKFLTVE